MEAAAPSSAKKALPTKPAAKQAPAKKAPAKKAPAKKAPSRTAPPTRAASKPPATKPPATMAPVSTAHHTAPTVHATSAADGVLVVPVRLPKGASQEIVLRIVLKIEE